MMKVTQEMIEKKVVDMIMNGKRPRFVLMDKKTLNSFSKQFDPKERIKLQRLGFKGRETYITKMQVTTECQLDFLEVKGKEDFFEVVG